MSLPSIPHVATKAGELVGTRIGDLDVFSNVPFAAPPVGDLRFELPRPALNWPGVRIATDDGPIAPQAPSRVYAAMGQIAAPQSEDCLSIKIWAPLGAETQRPVVVWLHGGGFMSGAGSLPWYNGEHLARKSGAIVVNVNYRLGALGFLCVPGRLSGNLAVFDQEQALLWIRDNIAAFGGDPDNVTVMGQSGGAHNIAMLLTSPRTERLFARAILLSPPLGIDLQTLEGAERSAAVFLDILGVRASDAPAALKRIDAASLVSAQGKMAAVMSNMARGDLRPPVMPVREGLFSLPGLSLIEEAARAAAKRGVDVVIGWTRDEANLFYGLDPAIASMDEASLLKHAQNLSPSASEALLEDARERKPGASNGQLFMEMVSTVCFRRPAIAFADDLTRAGGKAFVYQFDHESPDARLAACHCIDIPFIFGTSDRWANAPMLSGSKPKTAAKVTDAMMGMVSRFVTTGDPGLVAWRPAARKLTRINAEISEVQA